MFFVQKVTSSSITTTLLDLETLFIYTGEFLCIFILCEDAKKISKSMQKQAKKILIIKITYAMKFCDF